MRVLTIALLVGFLVPFANTTAQEQTLLKDGIESDGFGGIAVKFTGVNNQFGVLVGVRGGWIINHTFIIGAGDALFVAEPEINLVLNNHENIRLGVGGSYRFITGVDAPGLENGELAGPSGHIQLKFGTF